MTDEPAGLGQGEWGLRVPPRPGVGIHLADCFVGRSADVPEAAAPNWGRAPRGAHRETDFPSFDYRITTRSECWADDIADLYEKAKAGQWDATRDLPWGEIGVIDPQVELALCQVLTVLIEFENSAVAMMGRAVHDISPAYHEVQWFLITQEIDEARHAEAFRKRCLAGGGGLQTAAAGTEWYLRLLYDAAPFAASSFLMQVMGEGTFLDLFDFLHEVSPDPASKRMFARAGQDESRHVGYGVSRARQQLRSDPEAVRTYLAAAHRRAIVMDRLVGSHNDHLQHGLTVLAGGGSRPDQLRRGRERVELLNQTLYRNRLRRILSCGIDEDAAHRLADLQDRSQRTGYGEPAAVAGD